MNLLKRIFSILAFTGLWLVPLLVYVMPQMFPAITGKQLFIVNLAVIAWVSFNNMWSVLCEGKEFDKIGIGDGLMPDTGLRKEPAQKHSAVYPKVPAELLSKEPEGVVLGTYKKSYVRMPLEVNYHICVVGGSGAGKTSTLLLDTLICNFAAGKDDFQVFAIDIKGELHEKSVYPYSKTVQIVNPADRTSTGWDVYYRLHDNPSDDLVAAAIQEISEALIISTNPKDSFFVENARAMFTGMLIYYFRQEKSFIDSVNQILEADIKTLMEEIIQDSDPSDLHYKFLAKFTGKKAESVEDCIVELTTNLSVFALSDVKFCFRDNFQKTSPYAFKEGKSIFLAIEEHMLEQYRSVMRLCTVQVLKELERRSEAETKPVIVLIDEFARLGEVSGIFNSLATLRSKKVILILAFQSMAQMEAIYGREKSRVLVDNCRLKFIAEASDTETAKMVQAWAGKYRAKKETQNGGKNRSRSYTYEDRDIVETNDLITLTKKEEVILIVSGIGYLRVKKCYYFKDRKIKSLADKVREYNKQTEV